MSRHTPCEHKWDDAKKGESFKLEAIAWKIL